MSQRANYFKLGLFVIGAVVAGVVVLLIIGSGRWFQPKHHHRDVFQRIGAGSGHRLQAQISRRRDRRSDEDRLYLQQVPAGQADVASARATSWSRRSSSPKLLGGRAAAGDLTSPTARSMEVDRGLRVRLAPQGITGTSYLEIDYVDPPPPMLPIDWTPDNIYIPSARRPSPPFVNAAQRDHRPPAQARHRGHARQPQQAAGHDQRADASRSTPRRCRSVPSGAREARDDARQHRYEEALGRGGRR